MTQLAVSQKLITDNGRERRTDGLHKHLGYGDFGTLRAYDNQTAGQKTGAGVELAFIKPSTGYVLSYDRDASDYRDLMLQGKNVTIQVMGGKLSLPAGSVQARVASYATTVGSWQAPAGGSWYETPIQASGTFTGVEVRLEYSVSFYMSAAGAYTFVGLGKDGSPIWNTALWTAPAASYTTTISGVMYDTPAAGTHRYAVFLSANAGSATIHPNPVQTLWCVEQRA